MMTTRQSVELASAKWQLIFEVSGLFDFLKKLSKVKST